MTQRHHQQFSYSTSGLLSSAPSFVTDRSSLDRILRELLHNAIKYTPAQGQVQLHIDRTEHSPPQLQITLRNTGEIPTQFLPHLFDKFYRVPRPDPWSYGGTGLGLALAKQLVTLLQGEIQVSTQEAWIEFRVCLPDLSSSKPGSASP